MQKSERFTKTIINKFGMSKPAHNKALLILCEGREKGLMYLKALSSLMLTAILGCSHLSDSNSGHCSVPSMYMEVRAGLIEPTREPVAIMRKQIEGEWSLIDSGGVVITN